MKLNFKRPANYSFYTLIANLLILTAGYNAFAWSNGGFSDDPNNPDYGSHDWIAHHALDCLPAEERSYIVDNLSLYLYGTELPDNAMAVGGDGIGDTARHHVFYRKDGTLQDDAAAARAAIFYEQAIDALKRGDLAGAAKAAGIMSHYIADLAVFGHVMGPASEWGKEAHHSDYERWVNARTNSYNDEFNRFLECDGDLARISAYSAALNLAFDTTFDSSGKGLTAVWMDANYNTDDATFVKRAGESLNLAVNLIADVLNTMSLEALPLASTPTPALAPAPAPTARPEVAAPEATYEVVGLLASAIISILIVFLIYKGLKRRATPVAPRPSY